MSELTELLQASSEGDPDAAEALLRAVYDELKVMARRQMEGESAEHTLQPTALVHEAYLRLLGPDGDLGFRNRAHFFGAAGEAMRRLLIERARRYASKKRDRRREYVTLSDVADLGNEQDVDVLALDEALKALEREDPRLASLVKLRCFLGMTIAESAVSLGISAATVKRDWLYARAWLYQKMEAERSG